MYANRLQFRPKTRQPTFHGDAALVPYSDEPHVPQLCKIASNNVMEGADFLEWWWWCALLVRGSGLEPFWVGGLRCRRCAWTGLKVQKLEMLQENFFSHRLGDTGNAEVAVLLPSVVHNLNMVRAQEIATLRQEEPL